MWANIDNSARRFKSVREGARQHKLEGENELKFSGLGAGIERRSAIEICTSKAVGEPRHDATAAGGADVGVTTFEEVQGRKAGSSTADYWF